jgi:hypothetical protein
MSDTAITTTPGQPAPPAPVLPGPAPRPRSAWSVVKSVLAPVASLRLTVVLFVFALVLVFAGTLAQVDEGIWTVVNKYFRAAWVWMPLQIFFPRDVKVPGVIPFPGGWLIGGALLINLLAAHLVRFRLTWKRSGVLILHAGLIVMMLGELLTGLYAVEGNMSIPTGKAANYVEDHERPELAILSPVDDRTDDVVVIPKRLLRAGGLIQNDQLPFDVQVDRWMPNSGVPRKPSSGADNPATAGVGRELVAVERPEGNGVEEDQKADRPSAYVTFKKKSSGESLGTYLLTPWFDMMVAGVPAQKVTVDGKTYQVELRYQRRYKPYTIHLVKFTHSVYPGTEIPKDYRSKVRLIDPTLHEDREVEIYMNHPLRYRGETFYQSGTIGGQAGIPITGTILQVVRNPGAWLPYISCGMVALGMIVHFLLNLISFLRRRLAQ